MTRGRVIIYVSLFVLFVAAIFIKVQIIKKKANVKVVSIDSEWKEHGRSVSVYKIDKQDMGSFKKLSGTLKAKRKVSASATYGLRDTLRVGQIVKTIIQSGEEVKGKISRISNDVDLDLGLYIVEIMLEKDHDAEIGSIVVSNVEISSLSKIIKVPLDSIVEEAGKRYCWVIENSKATKKEITIGEKNGSFFEVIKGLHKNDLVVTDGKLGLKENSLVRIFKTIGDVR